MATLLAWTAAVATILGVAMLPRLLGVLRRWSSIRSIPAPPATNWLLGHMNAIINDRAPMQVLQWFKQTGAPVIRLRFLHSWMVVIGDNQRAQQVLQKSSTYCPKFTEPYKALEVGSDPAVHNVLTSGDGEYWKAVRAAWMKCFTSVQLKQLFPTVLFVCDRMCSSIEESSRSKPGQPVNVSRAADRITLDIIGRFNYDKDLKATANECTRYLELVTGMLQLMHYESQHPLVLLFKGHTQQQRQLRAEWDAANTLLVKDAMAHPPPDTTIAGQLLKVIDPSTGKPLSLAQLKSELVLATLAGFETTSNALSWSLGLLATHPAACTRLELELAEAGLLQQSGGAPPRSFEWRDLGRLPYLNAVIREALRLFSPAAMGSVRIADKDIELEGGIQLPKGTPLMVNLYSIGRNTATYGPDADAFRPERWLSQLQLQQVLERERQQDTDHQQLVQDKAKQQDASAASSKAMEAAAGKGSSSADQEGDGGTQEHYLLAGYTGDAQEAPPTTNSSSSDGPAPAEITTSSRSRVPDAVTFSLGPRDCAGQALARIELQVALSMLVGRFQLALAPEVGGYQGLLSRRMYHMTLQLRDGLPMVLTTRG